jgi:hypothetical protein
LKSGERDELGLFRVADGADEEKLGRKSSGGKVTGRGGGHDIGKSSKLRAKKCDPRRFKA